MIEENKTINALKKLKDHYLAIMDLIQKQTDAISGDNIPRINEIIEEIIIINLKAEELLLENSKEIKSAGSPSSDTEKFHENEILILKKELKDLLKDITKISMSNIAKLKGISDDTLKIIQELNKTKKGFKGYKSNAIGNNIDITE